MNNFDNNKLEVIIKEKSSNRLDKALFQSIPDHCGLSRTRVKQLIEKGAVCDETGKIRLDPSFKAISSQKFFLSLPVPSKLDVVAEPISIDIIYEDSDLLVVNKPVGMVVHPAQGLVTGTLVNALLYHCGDSLSGIGGAIRPGIVHRIDKDTSGLLLVAKNDISHQFLSDQFARHRVERKYQAIVWGKPTCFDKRLLGLKGVSAESQHTLRIIGNIRRHKVNRKKMMVHDTGKYACTRIKIKREFGNIDLGASLVECWLETGRTHQIRVHLSQIGHSIIGDQVYGSRRLVTTKEQRNDSLFINRFDRQALHANRLGFVHPSTKKYHLYEADLPLDMKNLLLALHSFF